MALWICGSCSRHIKTNEACPFCGAAAGHRAGFRPVSRATRAALALSVAVASTGALAACSDETPDDPTLQPAYGAPALDAQPSPDADTSDASRLDAAPDGLVSVDAAYGAPPPPDGGDAGDAGSD